MLVEWFQYLTTPSPKHLRAMGYPQEIIATQARYRRCREAWRPHLEHTKAFILEAAERAPGNRLAVILGSGVLLDIPLAELSQRFEQVILVDVIHLPWVKRHGLRYPNLRFAQLDVTGVCEILTTQLEQVREGAGAKSKLPERMPKPLAQSLGVSSIDFLASVNLLSQLPILPCAYLEKHHASSYSKEEREAFARAVINNHLVWLKTGSEQVCLITDLERVVSDDAGGVIGEEDALAGVGLPELSRKWLWDIAPSPEVHPTENLQHRIGGYSICSKKGA